MYGPLIVPVILTAIALFDVLARLQLVGTAAGLIVAHTVLALPYAYVVLNVALGAIDDSLEEAAWTLGATNVRAFTSITAVIVAPSILGALAIAFLASWDELVVAVFQAGIQKTLPVLFFGYVETGVPAQISAVGTMVVGVGLCAIALVEFGRRFWHRAQES
jgi:putative spermidine/putrescine transport system permease protein